LNLSSTYNFLDDNTISDCPDFDSGYMDKTILALLRNQYVFGEITSMKDNEFLKGVYMLLWAYNNQSDFFNEYDSLVNNRFIKRSEVPKKYKFKNEPFFSE
jgi:hypothetical protein